MIGKCHPTVCCNCGIRRVIKGLFYLHTHKEKALDAGEREDNKSIDTRLGRFCALLTGKLRSATHSTKELEA